MTRLLYYYPIVIASIATALHLGGTVGIYQPEVERGFHMLMYTLDLLVVIGLFAKSTWGYYLALLFCVSQTVLQSYWGFTSLSAGLSSHLIVYCPLVLIGLGLLLSQQELFLRQEKA